MLKVSVLNKKDAEDCPIRNVLDRVGDKWSVLILCALEDGEKGFNQTKRLIGEITQRVLTSTLRKLEADGYVLREVEPTSPPKVSYSLTDQGRELLAHLMPLVQWAEENQSSVKTNRLDYDR
ncbi:winged helix-turn-helix transcriptional regulator [Pseudovibrio sp. WM33]|uniref:winged helix-turn-helix transcriptional regulator n=1 Tax=Pseudovibrio sp. WM33 TaxID=1735585 RepID=UPI0007AE6646|nr:helix-turn-helix domain-containing protein [Pseudovibrio sp. WM33]KZL20009.1 putative HTH-type transcriptional regulator YybR [Pseudovibrio sp. WM33]